MGWTSEYYLVPFLVSKVTVYEHEWNFQTFSCNLLEQWCVTVIFFWQWCLGGNFLATRYGILVGLFSTGVYILQLIRNGARGYEPPRRAIDHIASHLLSIHPCFPSKGAYDDHKVLRTIKSRYLFCFFLLINKACMHHNRMPLLYIFR